jgi:hypothetical protein
LLTHHGSDKATAHDYHLLYANILERRRTESLKLLEIGLGTNDDKFLSSMGGRGRPGSSLRAFRDFLPTSEIFGADIDKAILFQDVRIKTFWVDQTAPDTFRNIAQGIKFDIIIDDGLHCPFANLATLNWALDALNPGGTVVVEDIVKSHLPVWHVVTSLLPAKLNARLIEARGGILFMASKS